MSSKKASAPVEKADERLIEANMPTRRTEPPALPSQPTTVLKEARN
ncbi:hypothetical protein WFZ85_14885 [Flavobacterium sp. j3]|uniref:Uncharacterized protein n=1 Tax=Flavobacterium aureirubrum TaxID=3133147 RepID=A0ABU9N8X5_9FLAO